MATPILGLQELIAAQAQPQIVLNLALRALEQFPLNVVSQTVTTPPASPADGVAYIVPTGGTGAWAGQDHKVAFYAAGWYFLPPRAGWVAYVAATTAQYEYNGTAWVAYAGGGGVGARSVTLVDLADLPANTLIGNNTGSSGVPLALTVSQVLSMLGLSAGGLQYLGTWNATTNTPTITSGTGTLGQFYKVATAGTTTIDGNSAWAINDMLIFDGTAWDKIDGSAISLSSTGVTAGTYGNGTNVGQFTVGTDGRLTSAVAVPITGAAPSGTAGGDLTGTYPSPTIKTSVSLTTPNINVASGTSLALTGTAGAGFVKLPGQSVAPASSGAGNINLYAVTTQGFTRLLQDNEATTDVTLGRDSVLIAKNTSGGTLNKGTVVYITGSTGNVPNFSAAKANALATTASLGVLVDNVANNAFGQVMATGIIDNFDTSAFTTGAQLFLSPTTAGAITTTRPSGSTYYVQAIGYVLVSGVGNGSIRVSISPSVLIAADLPPIRYDIDTNMLGTQTVASQVLRRFQPGRAITISNTNIVSGTQTAATASTVFTIYLNGTSVGTITYAAAGTTGTVSVASPISLNGSTDVLTIKGPATADATLADMSIWMAGLG